MGKRSKVSKCVQSIGKSLPKTELFMTSIFRICTSTLTYIAYLLYMYKNFTHEFLNTAKHFISLYTLQLHTVECRYEELPLSNPIVTRRFTKNKSYSGCFKQESRQKQCPKPINKYIIYTTHGDRSLTQQNCIEF